MALGDYEKTVYKNGEAPGISANNLNKNEDKTAELDQTVAAHLADYATDEGSANVYKITLTPAPTAYEVGKIYKFKATNTNTGASTLQIGTLTATAIKKNVSVALTAGDIPAGAIIPVMYDGTNFQLIPMAPPSAASETVAGIVELATVAEVTTGTDTTRAVTPAGLKANTGYKAGEYAAYTDTTETTMDSSTALTMTKLREVKTWQGGTLRVKFSINGWGDGSVCYGQVYRNGVAVGTLRSVSNTSTPTEFSEDISGWSAGDLVQIYCYHTSSTGQLKSFSICVQNIDTFTKNM